MLLEISVENTFSSTHYALYFGSDILAALPPPRVFNQLKEVITIRTEFNLGPDRHVAVTPSFYFVKKENQLSIILQETKRKHSFFTRNETRVSVTLLFVTIRFSTL